MEEPGQRRPQARRRILKRLAALTIGLGVAALAAEAATLLIYGEQAKFPRRVVEGDFGLRINKPSASYRHKSADVEVNFRINGKGLRADREHTYEKPEGVLRIVSLGDSYTMGYEVQLEDCFSSRLEKCLRERGFNVEVLNAGVSGYSNAEECLYLERELFKYDPDVVLVSFYANDLVDNVRTGLFGLEDGRLVQKKDSYVPLGRLGNYLNSSSIFGFLAERSNAFVMLKEQLTLKIRKRMVDENVRHLAQADGPSEAADELVSSQEELAAAIFERIYSKCQERGLPLVVGSIPAYRSNPKRLLDMFPEESFSVDRPGLHFLAYKDILDPHVDTTQLYWERSHWHWTPFAHREVARALCETIAEAGLLGNG